MSGLSLSVDVRDGATPLVRDFLARLTNRTQLNETIALRAHTLTRDHLIGLAGTRHNTANRLGATPKGHWALAAELTTFTADATSATITIAQPGIGRAFHDVEIYPGAGNKAITIPLIAQAYNLRAASVWKSEGLFVVKGKRSKGNAAVAVKRLPDGSLQPWYLLLPHVHQKQDRTLLPSDSAYQSAAQEGARFYVNDRITRH